MLPFGLGCLCLFCPRRAPLRSTGGGHRCLCAAGAVVSGTASRAVLVSLGSCPCRAVAVRAVLSCGEQMGDTLPGPPHPWVSGGVGGARPGPDGGQGGERQAVCPRLHCPQRRAAAGLHGDCLGVSQAEHLFILLYIFHYSLYFYNYFYQGFSRLRTPILCNVFSFVNSSACACVCVCEREEQSSQGCAPRGRHDPSLLCGSFSW